VGDKIYTAENILISTGSHPEIPNIPGRELLSTSDDFFTLEELPQKGKNEISLLCIECK
jgi:glutathione reductase (NADPH)